MAKKPEKKLTSKDTSQGRAIAAIISGKSDKEAAALAGVCPQTLSHWRNNDIRFIQRLRKEQNAVIEATRAKATEAVGLALTCVIEAITDRQDTRAAQWLLDHSGIFPDLITEATSILTTKQPDSLEEIVNEVATRQCDEYISGEYNSIDGALVRDGMIAVYAQELLADMEENSAA